MSCKGEWINDCPYPQCLCAKKIMLRDKIIAFMKKLYENKKI